MTQADVDRAWTRMLRTARSLGWAVHGWHLRIGTTQPGQPRTSWQIEDESGTAIMSLGYTRRTAYDALMTMGDMLDLIRLMEQPG